MRAVSCTLRFASFGAIFCLAAQAQAQGESRDASRNAFRHGVELLQEEKFEAARDALAEAYRLFPHPSILFDLGLARLHTGEYVQAERDLVSFLADDGGAPPSEIAGARETLMSVRSHLSTLSVRVAPTAAKAWLDDTPLALAAGLNAAVRVAAGEHTLRIEADGCKTRLVPLTLRPRELRALEVALAPTATDDGRSLRRAGYGFTAGSGLLAIAGGASGLFALDAAHRYSTPGEPDYQSAQLKSSGLFFRTAADISLLGAVALAATGITLVIMGNARSAKAAGGRAGFQLWGSF